LRQVIGGHFIIDNPAEIGADGGYVGFIQQLKCLYGVWASRLDGLDEVLVR